MYLRQLTLTNFKNIAEAQLTFSTKINCFLGDNGMGKSNLLDAIHYLSFCKSFTGVTDNMIIRLGEDFTMARASYLRADTPEEITFALQRGRRKSFKRGGKEYDRLSAHIGLFPLVMAAPQDIDLIRGSGEERRRWMDMVISQSDRRYLDALIRYNAALEQRNRLLRAGIVDHTLFEAIEASLDTSARYIHSARAAWIDELTSIFQSYYNRIAGHTELTGLTYRGSLASSPDGSLTALLDSARRHDEIVRHTTVGPHRDDIDLSLFSMPLRRTGSQGQCKSFTIAMRLAQYQFLRKATGLRPMLLLDDIFDKLDSQRVQRIIEIVTTDSEIGQIFLTDTNRRHLDEIISLTSGTHALWDVTEGRFTPLSQQ